MNNLSPPQKKSGFSDSEVMSQVKKERSNERAEVRDILKADVEKTGGDFIEVYSKLVGMVQSGKTRIMRSGNSLLIYNILSPGTAEVHISTIDKPKELINAVKEFYQAMTKAGFKSMVSTTNNSEISRVLSSAGIPIRVSQKPDASGQMTFELRTGA
jgi:hypothetical protein